MVGVVKKKSYVQVVLEIGAWMSVGMAFWFLLDQFYSGAIKTQLFNSDALFLPSLYQDLFHDGYRLHGWITPPNVYFFPDMLVLFICLFLIRDMIVALIVFALIQCGLLIISHLFLFRILIQDAERYRNARILLPFAGAVLIFLIGTGIDKGVFQTLLLSGHHTGVYIVSVFCLGLLIQLFRRENEFRSVILLLILSCFTMASDSLFALQFLLPAAMAGALFIRRGSKLRMSLIILFLFMMIVYGMVGQHFFLKSGRWFIALDYRIAAKFLIGMREHGMNAFDYVPFFRLLLKSMHPGLIAFWVFWFLAGIVCFAWMPRKEAQIYYLAFQILMVALNVCAVFLITVYAGEEFSTRYFLPVYGAPFFSGVFILIRMVPRRFQVKLGYGLALPLIALIFACSMLVQSSPFAFADYRPPIAVCMDEYAEKYNLKYGLADYWNAKPLSLFSKKGLHAYQVEGREPKAMFRANNFLWYYGLKKRFMPNFIITDRLNRAYFLKNLGPPSHILHCGMSEILVYNRKIEPGMRRFYDRFLKDLDHWRTLTGR